MIFIYWILNIYILNIEYLNDNLNIRFQRIFSSRNGLRVIFVSWYIVKCQCFINIAVHFIRKWSGREQFDTDEANWNIHKLALDDISRHRDKKPI